MRSADAIDDRPRRRAVGLRFVLALLLSSGACAREPVAPGPLWRLELTPETTVIAAGDIVAVTAVAVDGDGTTVPVGPVAFTTDDAFVATIDAASRLRAVSPGRTRLRGVANGVVGDIEIEVVATPARFVLERFEGGALPVLVDADSVDWGEEREYHEVFVVSGAFALVGGSRPRYELLIRYEEYDVRFVGNERRTSLRFRWNEYDRGTIAYSASGDLEMTSEIFAPLHHRSSSVSGGFAVDYRVPGTDAFLNLFYRR